MKKYLWLLLISFSFAAWIFPVTEPVYYQNKVVCTDWYSNLRTENGKTYKYQAVNYPCRYGTLIRAPFNGVITNTQIAGYEGAIITIKDEETGNEMTICHLSKYLVLDDAKVWAGQPIALSGRSGRTTGSHVRIRLDKDGIRQFIAASTWGLKYSDFIYSGDTFDSKKAIMYRK